MSTATEITRLQTARNTIRDKLIEFGLATSTAKLDALATAVDGIENKGAISASVQEGDTYTIPKGYHNGSGTVSGVAGGGNYSLQSKTVTPTKSQQSVTPDQGFYGLSDVTVKPIPDKYADVSAVTATAEEVLKGADFVSPDGTVVTGTMPYIGGAFDWTLDATDRNQLKEIPKGYHDGNGRVKIELEEKTVTPIPHDSQIIAPSDGRVLSKVTVMPIPTEYADISDATTASAADVLAGKIVYGKIIHNDTVTPIKLTGTMPNNNAVAATIDGLTNTSYTIPKGYHSGSGTVSLTNDIETAFAAI